MNSFDNRQILTVSQLTSVLRGMMEECFPLVWVEGEISNLSAPASGHLYFTLKDPGAQIRCVIFRSTARMLRFTLKDGMGLILRGRMSVYEQRGEYQLVGDWVEPRGVGALQLAFVQLKEKLQQEGLFAPEHKKPLPMLPQCVGIVTSPTGAAIRDLVSVLGRRNAGVRVLLRGVRVQGEGAAAEIAEAIDDLNAEGSPDVIIVGRGGGSIEDLWAFNEEVVARAIHRSAIPVVSAVGHETDFTISDFVADLRAPTPSAAAELVVRNREDLADRVDNLARRLRGAMETRLERHRGDIHGFICALKDPRLMLGRYAQRLDDLTGRLHLALRAVLTRRVERVTSLQRSLGVATPLLRVEQCRELLVFRRERLELALLRQLEKRREELSFYSGKLDALSPLRTLRRGYAVVRKLSQGAAIVNSVQLQPGERVGITFSSGSAVCTVEETSDVDAPSKRRI